MKQNDRGFYELARARNLSDVTVLKTHGTTRHFHHQIEVLIVIRGSLMVKINDKERILNEGSAAISDSFDAHCYELASPEGEGRVVIVPKNNILSEYSALMKNQVFEDNFLVNKKAFKLLKSLVLTLEQNLEESNYLLSKGLVLSIMGVFQKYLPLRARGQTDKTYLMKDVLEYIHTSFADNLALPVIAKRFGYTANHFSHIFRNFTGVKLGEYLNSVRLGQVISMLLQDKSIIDSAMSAGFESLRTFYRVFYDNLGMTPNAYIKKFFNQTS